MELACGSDPHPVTAFLLRNKLRVGERQVICRGLVPVVVGGFVAHVLAEAYPTSVLPVPAAAVSQVQVSLDSQESACSEKTIRQEDVKLS